MLTNDFFFFLQTPKSNKAFDKKLLYYGHSSFLYLSSKTISRAMIFSLKLCHMLSNYGHVTVSVSKDYICGNSSWNYLIYNLNCRPVYLITISLIETK